MDLDLDNVDQGPEGVFLIHEEESDGSNSVEALQTILTKSLARILATIFANMSEIYS